MKYQRNTYCVSFVRRHFNGVSSHLLSSWTKCTGMYVCTETANKNGTWLREISSCCCLTRAGKTRQLLLNKIYIPIFPSAKVSTMICMISEKEGKISCQAVNQALPCPYVKLAPLSSSSSWRFRSPKEDPHGRSDTRRFRLHLKWENRLSFSTSAH